MKTAIPDFEKHLETCEFHITYAEDEADCGARDGQRPALFTYDRRYAAPLLSGAVA
jgi:hypothetical protein